jgi:hypothetical protein
MKKIIITSLSTLLLFSAVLFNACEPDVCKNVSCAYGGTCKDGSCLCQTGYEGEHCETVTREKFKGIWNVNEDGTITPVAQYAISIENGAKINEVKIINFQNKFTEPVIGIAYKDTLTVPLQTFSNGYKVEGWATITDTNPLNQHYFQHATMNFYYKVTDNNGFINEFGTGSALPSLWSK